MHASLRRLTTPIKPMIRSTPLLILAALAAGCGTDATPEPDDLGTTSDTATDSVDTAIGSDSGDAPESDIADPDTAADAPPADVRADVDESDSEEDAPEPDTAEDVRVDGEPDTPDSDTPEPDTPEPDTPESDTGDDRICASDDSAFPEFRSLCREAADCTQAFHQIDCCGTIAAIGVLASSHDDFLAAEERCRGEYDACRCAARPTQTDDGVLVTELSEFDVACEAGACVSVGRGDTEGVVCTDRVPVTFPEFDNSCEVYDDCVAVPHQYDCCGNMHMVGINVGYVDAFDPTELNCRAAFPLCGCPVGPLSTDAGTFAGSPDMVEAMCREGVCYTYVPL